MNKKISLPEISRIIADNTGYDINACEIFVKELFTTISQTLIEGESVKVKGLGTFKITRVEQRKSVNVNTGEQMTIPEHSKVSFTPDKALSEVLNAPFAMFEPVELSDQVTEQMLDQAERTEQAETNSDTLQSTSSEAADNDLQEIVNQDDNNTAEGVLYKDTDQPSNNATQPVEESIIVSPPEEKPEDLTSNDEEIQEGTIFTTALEDQIKETSKETIDIAPEENDGQIYNLNNDIDEESHIRENENLYETPKKNHFFKGFLTGVLSAIAVCALLFLGYKYLYPLISESDTQTKEPKQIAVNKPEDKKTAAIPAQESNQEQPQAEEILPTTTPEIIEVPTETSDNKGSTAENIVKEDTKKEITPSQIQEEPKEYSDKITKKRYLTTMAREYYGNYNLWPLIYDYNKGLGHPDRIRPGTKIKVPTTATLGIDPKDPEVVRKAKQRGVDIYAKYR